MKPGAPKGRTMAQSADITREMVLLINGGALVRDIAWLYHCTPNSVRRRLKHAGYILKRRYIVEKRTTFYG